MIDRPTSGDQIRFQDWRYLQERFHRGRQAVAGRRRSLRGAVRVVQRAHRPASHGQRLTATTRVDARHGAPHRRHHLRAADRHPRRVLDAHRVRQRRGTPPKQRYKLIVADADGENPADDRDFDRAAHVAGLVARRAEPRVRFVREQSVRRSTCRRCARASVGAFRRAPASMARPPGRRTAARWR